MRFQSSSHSEPDSSLVNESSGNYSEELRPQSQTDLISAAVFVGVVVVIAFIEFGNLMTIISFVTYRRLRRPRYIPVVSMASSALSNTCLYLYIPVVSMACSDLLYGLSSVFFLYVIERQRQTKDKNQTAFYLTAMIVGNILVGVSAWHLVVLAVDRFIAVRFPMSYRGMMTSRCITKMTIGCWLMAVVFACPYLTWMFVDVRSVTDSNVTCYHFESDNGPVPLAFDFSIQFFVYATVSVTIVLLNVSILVAARRSRLQPQHQSSQDTSNSSRHYQNNAIYGARSIGSRGYTMITIIIVAYIVAWAPYFIVQMIRLTSMSMCLSTALRIANMVSSEFGTLNAGINFIVYALVNKDFRHAYKSTFTRLCHCARSASMPMSQDMEPSGSMSYVDTPVQSVVSTLL